MNLQFPPDSVALLPGLALFGQAAPKRSAPGAIAVEFEGKRKELGFSLSRQGAGFLISYARPCDAYRALGLLLAGAEELSQNCAHETVGVMWDLSRNGVLHLDAWEGLLRKFALLGINSVQLYMEDVYEISGEPFFGYGRGAYSVAELQYIDDCGNRLGIEIIPCIQTLGHMGQILQWPPYRDLIDYPGVLMVGEKKTKELIGTMLDHLSACFRSRVIHIGMDEAHGVGTGKYLAKNGWQRPFDILTAHLQMVVEMCRERELKPMIWSDMFFRIGSVNHDYYDRDSIIPQEVVSCIPGDVELVYWDYYHADPAFYSEWIKRHRAMGKEPVFAAGAWNWGRFWAYAPRWRESIHAGMKAAREEGLSKALLTIWGDDGDEFHPASILPAVQYLAEWAYAGEPDQRALERQFAVISEGSSLSDYLLAAQLDEVPAVRGLKECTVNYSKWILWQDAVLGFLDAHITPDLPAHYSQLAGALESPGGDEAIQFAIKVARAVEAKSELHLGARAAWKRGDGAELHRLLNDVLPRCLLAVHQLWEAHRAIWHEWRKPFGWEVIELRYAGCVARLESLGTLLDDCVRNPGRAVSEWDFDPLPIHERVSDVYFNYNQTTTPSIIK